MKAPSALILKALESLQLGSPAPFLQAVEFVTIRNRGDVGLVGLR